MKDKKPREQLEEILDSHYISGKGLKNYAVAITIERLLDKSTITEWETKAISTKAKLEAIVEVERKIEPILETLKETYCEKDEKTNLEIIEEIKDAIEYLKSPLNI